MDKTLLIAHTGCDGTVDNTLESLDYALNLDVDCVEADVRRAPDGALVLAHDAAAENSARLSDALAALRAWPAKKLDCDLKEPGLELSVWTLAKNLGVEGQLVFSGAVSRHAARVEPSLFAHVDWHLNIELIVPGLSPFAYRQALSAPGLAERLRLALITSGARCVNAHYSIAHTIVYDAMRRAGIPVCVWTPGDESRIRRFLADGVYGITTRNARRASVILKEKTAVGDIV